jgi:Tfp pilus assembly protein PilE
VSKRYRAIVVALVSVIAPLATLSGQASPAVAERGYVSAMKKDLRQLATAEEAYFMDNNGYYAGTVSASNPLFGFAPSPNVTIKVEATDAAHLWTATATHALTSTKCTYHLPQPIVCDPTPDNSMLATPRGGESRPFGSPEASAPTTTVLGTSDSLEIRGGRSRSWEFAVRPPHMRCVVSGQVVGLSGGDKKIAVLVMTEFAYEDWMKNLPARTYFESEPRTETPFDVKIEEEGRYRLVVWNPSTTAPTKIVQLQHTQVDCTD